MSQGVINSGAIGNPPAWVLPDKKHPDTILTITASGTYTAADYGYPSNETPKSATDKHPLTSWSKLIVNIPVGPIAEIIYNCLKIDL
jgi:hypothetical protein